jgi:hypothetical protein
MTRLRLRHDVADPAFVALILHAYWLAGYSQQRAKHWVNQAAVDQTTLAKFSIPLPPLSEQRRIVAIMHEAEAVRRLRAEAARKTADIIPAIFHDMFGDPEENPKDYRRSLIGDVVLSCDYGCSTRANEDEKGIPMLRMNNVTSDGELDLSELKHVELPDEDVEKYGLRSGDILFNRTNSRDLVGKTGLWDGRYAAIAASYFIRVRLATDTVLPEYFVAYMNQPATKQRLRDISKGAVGQSNINAKDLQSLPILVPPLSDQATFRDSLIATSELRKDDHTGLRLETALGNSLLAHAFTGDLTTEWRERHKTELAKEAAERDNAFREAGVTLRRPEAPEPGPEVAADARLAELTPQQLTLAQDLRDQWAEGEQYTFTPKSLAMVSSDPELRHNPDLVRRHLDVLAARGFVIRLVRREKENPTERESFAVSYRCARREGDDFSHGNAPDIEHAFDDVRSDALNRMARRLREGK